MRPGLYAREPPSAETPCPLASGTTRRSRSPAPAASAACPVPARHERQQLGVAFERLGPYPLFAPARCASGDPLLDPLPDRHPIRRDMLASIAGPDQAAQFFL